MNSIEKLIDHYELRLAERIDQDVNARAFQKRNTADGWVDTFANYDPSGRMVFTQWLILKYLSGGLQLRDLEAAETILSAFMNNRHLLRPSMRDIGRYKDFPAVCERMADFPSQEGINFDRGVSTTSRHQLNENDAMLLVTSDATHLKFIPARLWSRNLFLTVITANIRAAALVPAKIGDQSFWEEALDRNPQVLKMIDDDKLTPSMLAKAMDRDGLLLRIARRHRKTTELIDAAIRQNPDALAFAGKTQQKQFRESAVQAKGAALRFVPRKERTRELAEIAVRSNGEALKHVPEAVIDRDLCELALANTATAAKFIPMALRQAI